jgi:hypothetical protein
MIRVAAILLLPLLVLQDAGRRPLDTGPDSEFAAIGQQASLRLYVFDCGRIRLADTSIEMFGLTTAETDVRELIVPCYVIEHERCGPPLRARACPPEPGRRAGHDRPVRRHVEDPGP